MTLRTAVRSAIVAACVSFLGIAGAVFSGCASAPHEQYNGLKPNRDQLSQQLAAEDAANGHHPGDAYAAQVPRLGSPNARTFGRNPSQTRIPAPAGVAPDEELWVIEKPGPSGAQAGAMPNDDVPGSGALMAKLPDSQATVPIPLKRTDVHASVSGYIAQTDVTQQYQNPFSEKIEAVYVFPLPHDAAVNSFVMSIGDRHIRGIIAERQEAERIYGEAKQQGYVASLLTQERPNVFTQSVANIEPGKEIDVHITYFHRLEYVDGWYEYVFPMVVGPRFNPPEITGGIGAVPRGQSGASGQTHEVQYLRPNERSGHDISVAVQIDAGMKIEQIACPTHQITTQASGESSAVVTLDPTDSIPNRDFVLRYRVAGDAPKAGLLVHRDAHGEGGYFTLMLVPPASLEKLPRQPLEMVFTVDVSGSQSGQPLDQSKAAVRYALTHLDERDTFQLIKFGDVADQVFPQPVPASSENVQRALAALDSFQAGGGTMLDDGLRASLEFPHDPGRLRVVTFLTDGFIGNEAECLGTIHRELGDSRIFSFGVGSSTNRYLLAHMAKMGRGAAAFLLPSEPGEPVMAAYFQRLSHPAMTDVSIDFGGMHVSDVYPRQAPDLYVGRPVTITGRFTGKLDASTIIRISGTAGGQPQSMLVKLDASDAQADHSGIDCVWARARIADLLDRATYEANADLEPQVTAVAKEYGLLSPFTAFFAVDATAVTAGDHGTTVAVPVPVPQGVKYETTVPGTN